MPPSRAHRLRAVGVVGRTIALERGEQRCESTRISGREFLEGIIRGQEDSQICRDSNRMLGRFRGFVSSAV